MGANQENLLQAQIEFCDGWHDVLVTPIQQGGSECEPQGAFWVVRQSPLLLAWYKRYYSNDMQVTSDGRASPAVSSLAGVLDTIARQTGEHLFQARRLLPELGNVILRDYSQALQVRAHALGGLACVMSSSSGAVDCSSTAAHTCTSA